MIASAIAYLITGFFLLLGAGGIGVGFSNGNHDDRFRGLVLGVVSLAIAYGCARLGGI